MKRLIHNNLVCLSDSNRGQEATSGKPYNGLQFKMFIFMLLLAVMPFSKLFSNNLSVSVIAKDQSLQTVTFDLSWDNSWRNDGTVAKNWDAAWVFVKWRDCTASSNVQFTHGLISTTVADHSFNVLSGTTTFEPTTGGGTAGIDDSPNNTGVMLRNLANPSSGTVSARVTLKVTNLPASGTLDLRVYGIEMVYVPAGTYYLGDGNASSKSTYSFASAAGGSTALQISTESAQSVYESSTLLCLSGNCALSGNFPKGYGSFYIMKYEITQQAYADFLNGASALVQSIHFPNSYNSLRHTVNNSVTPGTFTADRPYRASNYLSWADAGAYLAWAALRPLTELEYEKACRGTSLAVPFENSMGITTGVRAAAISGSSPENGTETITTSGANLVTGTTAYTGGDAGQGPLRGGIFATSGTTTRSQTGASFYGVMELSGNVDEFYVSASAGTVGGSSSNGISLGSGMLDDLTGHFNTYGWPSPIGPNTNIIRRGGNWNTSFSSPLTGNVPLSLSNRTGGATYNRDAYAGGRGGRSVTVNGTYLTSPATFSYTGTMQYFVVPPGVTTLTIDAFGAGGRGSYSGRGAEMKGACTVYPGEVLQILVGGTGNNVSGGGGGTFVVRAPYNTLASALVVAGGGGGANYSSASLPQTNRDGQLGTNGSSGGGGSGGSSGGGGGGSGGGGGGGFLSNGGAGSFAGGTAFVNGGTIVGCGGFGGGGNSNCGSTYYSGGGGGYSGGGAGSTSSSSSAAGGGGSVINGISITKSQTGTSINTNGQLILNW